MEKKVFFNNKKVKKKEVKTSEKKVFFPKCGKKLINSE